MSKKQIAEVALAPTKTKKQTLHKKKKAPVQQQQQAIVQQVVKKVQYSYLVSHLQPSTQMQAVYTGGKIIFHSPHFYSTSEYKVYIWDYQTQQIFKKISHEGEEIANFALNSSGTFMATYTTNNLLRLLQCNKEYEQISVLKVPQHFPIDMAFSSNGKYLALGCVNSHVKIYSIPSLKESHQHKGHTGTVRKIEWHPTQSILYSIDENGVLCVFDCIKSKVVRHVEGGGNTFSLTQLGSNLVSVGESITVYDGSSLSAQYKLQLEEPHAEAMCLFGDQPCLIFGGEGRKLNLLNLNDKSHSIQELDGLYSGILMKIMRISELRLALISSEQNISIVEYSHGKFDLIKTILGYNDEILDIKFSKSEQSNSDIIAMATNSALIKLYNLKTKQTQLISGHKEIVLGLSYEYPWLASSGKDNVVKLWHFESLMKTRLVATYKGHSADVTAVAISLINQQLVSVSEDKSLKIWPITNYETPKIVKNSLLTSIAHDKSINAVKWSPDEEHIATCSQDKLIKIFSKRLQLQLTFKGHRRGVWDIAFHPNEKILASVSADGSLKIWNLSTGECVSTMGEGQPILKAQWLFNNQVATATNDGILRLWDIRKSTSVAFDNHIGRIWAMDVSKRDEIGKCHVVTAGIDSKILLWRDCTEEKLLEGKMIDEAEERTKLTYDIAINEGNYLEAGKLAFRAGYDELFVKAVQKGEYDFSDNTLASLEQEEVIFTTQNDKPKNFILQDLIMELVDIDLIKLLKILQNLNTISRYFKLSNRMLNIILGNISVSQLLELQRTFHDQKRKHSLQDFNRKQSDFEEYLSRFQSYNEKHSKRLDHYHKKSYWMDYQSMRKL